MIKGRPRVLNKLSQRSFQKTLVYRKERIRNMTFFLGTLLSGVKLGISSPKRRKRQILVGKQIQSATEKIWESFVKIYICILKNFPKTSCFPWQEPLVLILKTQNVLSSDRSPFWNVCFCIFVSRKHVKYLSFAIVLKLCTDTPLCNIITTVSYARSPGKCHRHRILKTIPFLPTDYYLVLLFVTSTLSSIERKGSSPQLLNMW